MTRKYMIFIEIPNNYPNEKLIDFEKLILDEKEGLGNLLTEEIGTEVVVKARDIGEWISVSDKMPDRCGRPCLLYGTNSFGQKRVFEGFTGYMERGKLEFHTNNKEYDIKCWKITHWMPLPNAPLLSSDQSEEV